MPASLTAPQVEAILDQQTDFSNSRTDAGELDVMKAMPGPDGAPRHYDDLAGDARVLDYAGVRIRVASLNAMSPPKSSPTGRRTKRLSPS